MIDEMIDELEQIIFYFEGTCEICLGNLGIEKYRQEVNDLIHRLDDFSDDIKLRILYASAIIEYKLENTKQHLKTGKRHWNMRCELTISSISERYTQIWPYTITLQKTSLWNCIILKRRSAFLRTRSSMGNLQPII